MIPTWSICPLEALLVAALAALEAEVPIDPAVLAALVAPPTVAAPVVAPPMPPAAAVPEADGDVPEDADAAMLDVRELTDAELEVIAAMDEVSSEVEPVAEATVAVTVPELTVWLPQRACWSSLAVCWSAIEQFLRGECQRSVSYLAWE